MSKVQKVFVNYNWFIKLIGAALLIALALILWLVDVEPLIQSFVGILIGVYAIVRLVPFVRTQRSDLIKTINIIEITLNVLIAAFLIISAFTLDEGLGAAFGYIIAFVLIARGMVHFYGLSEGSEKGDHITYFFHIATLVVGTVIAVYGFEVTQLIILFIILALMASAYIGFEGYRGFSMYRKRKQLEEPARDEAKEEADIRKAPSKEEEERKRDEIVS